MMKETPERSALSPTDLLRPKEVAEILHCRVDYVWQLCREGKLKAVKKGRHYLIPRQSVTDYIVGQLGGK